MDRVLAALTACDLDQELRPRVLNQFFSLLNSVIHRREKRVKYCGFERVGAQQHFGWSRPEVCNGVDGRASSAS